MGAGAGLRAAVGQEHPRLLPTYLLGVEVHEAHHVAIFLESDKEVHHRREGKESEHCQESGRGRARARVGPGAEPQDWIPGEDSLPNCP